MDREGLERAGDVSAKLEQGSAMADGERSGALRKKGPFIAERRESKKAKMLGRPTLVGHARYGGERGVNGRALSPA